MSYLERVFRATEEENRRTILATLRPSPGATLLDLGCGPGDFTMRVAKRVGAERVLGVEFVESSVEKARSLGVDVQAVDLGGPWPYEDASIDVVHSNQVIEHLPRTDHFLKEIHRVLKPDGHAVISTNNLASWHNVVSLVLGFQPTPCHVSDEVIVGNPANIVEGRESEASGDMHQRIFTARALAELARFHGFDVEVDRTAGYYPLPPRLSRIATRVDRPHGAFLVQRYGIARS